MPFLIKKNSSAVVHENNKSILTAVSAFTGITMFAMAVLFSSSAMADNSANLNTTKAVKVSQQQTNKSHVTIIHKDGNHKDTQHKMDSRDSEIGAYSLSDGARSGAYGDGVYSTAE